MSLAFDYDERMQIATPSEPTLRYREWKRRGAPRSLWRQHVAWLRGFNWPERAVIVLFEVTGAYLVLIAGMVLGLVLRFLID
jgi:hypothetical protein